ncbi:CYSTEINE-RICH TRANSMEMBRANE MODULE 12-like protein [Drosera capensis]
MAKTQTQDNVVSMAAAAAAAPSPPAGYPTDNPTMMAKKKKSWTRFFSTKRRGEKGCIEGCLAGLCCCFVCEECCC